MAKKARLAAVTTVTLSADEHIALLHAEHAHALAHARQAHARTRVHLQQAMIDLQRMRTRVAALEEDNKAKDCLAAVQVDETSAKADADAATSALANLTQAIRQSHNLTERHAIDSVTGEIISPEAQL